jgi:hypothetical protein
VGGTASNQLTISNSGASPLIFTTSFSGGPGDEGESDAHGGPDGFGYSWIDSDDPGGPTFNWKDISSSGTLIIFPHNDSTSAALPIGFNFPFYGQMQTSFIVSANGWLSFTSHSNAYNNTALPSASAPPNLLAGFWDDLDPLQSGAQVRTWSNNVDSLVISYLAVPHWNGGGTYTFQIILTANGDLKYQYQTVTGTLNSCTVGMQNNDGTMGLQVVYNQTYLHDGLAVKLDYPFLRAIPSSGGVSPGQNLLASVIASAYGIPQGTYQATMHIINNDPLHPDYTVPITVYVGGSAATVSVTLTPINPPIIIPANGGSFSFNASVHNNTASPQTFNAWIMQYTPGGIWQGPMLGPLTLTLPANFTVTRTRNQNVPSTALAGVYTYRGYTGTYPSVRWDSSSFEYTKSSTNDGGAVVADWDNSGESFEAWLASSTLPDAFALHAAYPNPFNPSTTIAFDLPRAAHVKLAVFDLQGRVVATLAEGTLQAGKHEVLLQASSLASGIYFVRLTAKEFTATQKLLLLK